MTLLVKEAGCDTPVTRPRTCQLSAGVASSTRGCDQGDSGDQQGDRTSAWDFGEHNQPCRQDSKRDATEESCSQLVHGLTVVDLRHQLTGANVLIPSGNLDSPGRIAARDTLHPG